MSILQYGFMQRAFLVGILLAVITPCIGITIVLKRMSMIGDALSHSSLAGVVVAYNGISVADDTKLRKELREAGVHYMVVKNTMLRLAVKGTQYEGLTEYFKGDTAIALSAEDPAAAARILCKFADADKSKRFVVKGGFCDGQVMDAAGIKSLSTMPNREGLLSMLAGSLNGIIGGLAVAIQGIVDKQEETPAA